MKPLDVEQIIRETPASPSTVIPDNAPLTGGTKEDFLQVGCDVFRSLVTDGGPRPHERVLEIGSGLGRVGYPLTRYIREPGSYLGLEIVKESVEFCNRHLVPLSSRFRYRHEYYYSEFYDPAGAEVHGKLDLELQKESFDFIFMSFCDDTPGI